MVTSLSITEDAIEFSNEGKLVGKLYKHQMHPQNIAEFTKANYNLQGTVKYDAWVAGAFAGLSLLLGEHMIGPEDREEISPTDPIEHSVVELTGDGTGRAAVPLVEQILSGELTAASPELLPGEIVVPGHTVIDGMTVQSIESVGVAASNDELALVVDGIPHKSAPIGEVSPEPVASEAIVPTAETPAAVGETIVPVSESPAAVANPEASGAALP